MFKKSMEQFVRDILHKEGANKFMTLKIEGRMDYNERAKGNRNRTISEKHYIS